MNPKHGKVDDCNRADATTLVLVEKADLQMVSLSWPRPIFRLQRSNIFMEGCMNEPIVSAEDILEHIKFRRREYGRLATAVESTTERAILLIREDTLRLLLHRLMAGEEARDQ